MQFRIIDSDYSALEGTRGYCSPDAAATIRQSVARLPLDAIHVLGTGDYHYVTLFWLERITTPFSLMLFDNHPDDQTPAFGGDVLSCGSWVKEALGLPLCTGVTWFDGKGREHSKGNDSHNVYLSIDLDMLGTEWVLTDWDQGEVSLPRLCEMLRTIARNRNVIGADICGGLDKSQRAATCVAALNESCMRSVEEALLK